MAKALNGSSNEWLLPDLQLNDLLLADGKSDPQLPEHHSHDENSVSALFRRMAPSFLYKDEDFDTLLVMQNHNSASSKRSGDEFYPNPSLTQHKIEVAQFYYRKKQQLIENQLSAARGTQSVAKGSRPLGFFFSSSSSALKSQPGSGMRAVLFNPRKESSGTGVFLPRQSGSPNEPRKQPVACATALLPARVVQALNLNRNELYCYPRAPSHGIRLAGDQKRSSGRNRSPWAAGNADRLPPEWTY